MWAAKLVLLRSAHILFLQVYSYFSCTMKPTTKPKNSSSQPRKHRKMSESSSLSESQSSVGEQDSQLEEEDSSSSSSGWSDEVIEPAIKTMTFRAKRGTRMKELMKGKPKNDMFWNRYQGYFGGGLDGPEDSDDEEDYEASSSGRDEFDSDFDLTDSYVGKRGRKKGSKVKRKQRKVASKNAQTARKNKKRQVSEEESSDKKQQQKMQQISTSQCGIKVECIPAQTRKKKMDICSQNEDNMSASPKQACEETKKPSQNQSTSSETAVPPQPLIYLSPHPQQ